MVVDSETKAGPCFGDSGGPIYVQKDNRWYIAGDFMGWDKVLVSEDAATICEKGQGIYNFAGDFASWIEQTSTIELDYDEQINPD